MRLPAYIQLLRVPFGQRIINLVLISGREKLLVDSGMSYSFEPYVLPGLIDLGAAPEDLDWLVNLHAHSDHIGGNALLYEASQGHLRIACHRDDAPYIREPLRVVRDLYGMPEDHPRYSSSVKNCGRPAPVHLELVDGVVFDLGDDVKMEVIAAPGHSPGNISLYDSASQTLIHGESILGVPQRLEDGRLTAPFGFSTLVYRRTLERLLKLPIGVLVPAHQELMDGKDAKALILECIEAVDAYIEMVRQIVKDSEASLDDVYAKVSRKYHLRNVSQVEDVYRAVGESE